MQPSKPIFALDFATTSGFAIFRHGDAVPTITGQFSDVDLDELELSRVPNFGDELKKRIIKHIAGRIDNEIRRMLGLWVSELEPVITYSQNGDLLGLSREGSDVILISVLDDCRPHLTVYGEDYRKYWF